MRRLERAVLPHDEPGKKVGHHRVIVTGGGTAGHVLPAYAIASALVREGVAAESITYVGALRGLESKLSPPSGIESLLLAGRGIQRRFSLDNLGALVGLSSAFLRALMLVATRRPSLVVSVGGYAGVPVALAGVCFRVPLVVVNIDSTPGAANRLLSRFAQACYVAFANSGLPRAQLTGAPVRDEVLAVRRDSTTKASVCEALQLDPKVRLVVIAGGSLGAASINAVALGLKARLLGRDDIALVHVCGERNLESMQRATTGDEQAAKARNYVLFGYTELLPELYAAADLVVSRAGAMTVAELCVIGVASVLLPLPGAPGDHQTKNARALVDAGAAVLVDDAGAEQAIDVVLGLLEDDKARRQMDHAAKALGNRKAADDIARRLIALAGERSNTRAGSGERINGPKGTG